MDNKKSKYNISKKEAIKQLWSMGDLSYKLKGIQLEMRNLVYDSEHDITIFLVARQSGKCIISGTYVATPKGSVKIEDLNVGDEVVGYNSDGSTSLTKVEQVHVQGIKEVVDLKHRGRIIASTTMDHRWQGYNTRTKKLQLVTTRELLKSKHIKIKREYFNYAGTEGIEFPSAYSLGAFLGDGYSKHHNSNCRQFSISSEDDIIPKTVAQELGLKYWKQSGNNFSWLIGKEYKPGKGTWGSKIDIPYYNEWCRYRKAHEKICDYEVIKTWNRESQLRFIAGLIDTDGCVRVTGRNKNELKLSLSMQAESVIDCVKNMFLDLWQIELCEKIDDRDKYVNGPCYEIYSNNNFCVKRALKELTPHIKLERKQYKSEYDNFPEYNHKCEYVGVIAGDIYEAETYDIGVNNGTHLYCLANGLVTHNSYTMCTIATEYCQRTPNVRVLIVFPKKKDAASIAKDQMRKILEDCPPHMKPEYMVADKTFVFPNGSEIVCAGTDGGSAESIRGRTYHLALMDEAGFHDYNEFRYILNSIIAPTLTTTDGKIIMASTPSKEVDHPFMTDYVDEYRNQGWLVEYDIYANPLITDKRRAKIIKQFPLGEEDPDYQREYLLKTNVVTSLMAIPEWYDIKDDVVIDAEKPAYYDAYVSMDPAVADGTGIVFGYYDYLNRRLVICDEDFIGGEEERTLSTEDIANSLERKEKINFSNPLSGEVYKPYMRISDNNMPLLLNDLLSVHDKQFIATQKDNKADKVNSVRMKLKRGEIVISPKCVNLIHHIQTAKWDKTRKKFVKNKGNKSKGIKANHSDLLDALVYLVRNYQPEKNPYPDGYFEMSGNGVFQSRKPSEANQKLVELANAILNIKR